MLAGFDQPLGFGLQDCGFDGDHVFAFRSGVKEVSIPFQFQISNANFLTSIVFDVSIDIPSQSCAVQMSGLPLDGAQN